MSQFPEYGVPESKVSDNLIIGAVRNALGESEEVDTSDIVVDAADGIIRLTGVVSTFYEKRKAGRLARAAEGVKGVDNSLVVVPDKQPTDQKIFDAIDKALGNFPEGRPARIGVRMVESGVAYISGKASNAQEAWNAIDIASKIPGVKDIVDEIDIAPGEPIDDVEI
ncbi:MAG TPA: BON domain-containing protein, partial [Armatimonadota bacterium]|nr:BON domain-containing protein [Armatimonadota bacterium]